MKLFISIIKVFTILNIILNKRRKIKAKQGQPVHKQRRCTERQKEKAKKQNAQKLCNKFYHKILFANLHSDLETKKYNVTGTQIKL